MPAMASNFLGDVAIEKSRSAIISAAEIMAREGINLQKGMTFRDARPYIRPAGLSTSSLDARSPVFLVLPREDGFHDEWDPKNSRYVYQGHDSTTVEGGKLLDQVVMYESGKLSENGKFYKAAKEFEDGVSKDSLLVLVYEKLDPGVWFDKGPFELVGAAQVQEGGRKVYKFYLSPAGTDMDSEERKERMIPAAQKTEMWQRYSGRCATCKTEVNLHFVKEDKGGIKLLCASHSGRAKRGLL
jgi:hypothetical protein